MPAAEVNRFPQLLHGRFDEKADCAICCLSIYLGLSYNEVLREVATIDKRNKGRAGLWTRQIQTVARRLGTKLRVKSKVEWDEDYGIVLLKDHVVVLRHGLIFEVNGDVWDADAYLKNNQKHLPVEGILLAVEEAE